ncbi:hypothetical protein JCM18918_102 [Cutibacterium acnes JCM 18918]|nr:hypothetical protein JCM18918_102 [Cutibacterium acnes JCM 18918]
MAIEVGMQVGIQVLFAGLVIFTLVMAWCCLRRVWGESSDGRPYSSLCIPPLWGPT